MEVFRVGSWLRIEAPAKLNLFLEVLGKRADGFHEIETLMVAISRCDTLFVQGNSEGKLRLNCQWASGLEARRRGQDPWTFGELPHEMDNIVHKAAERMRREAGTNTGATIRLVKRIPSAAGLGGASSDAAATIVALNEVWGLQWSTARLAEFAAGIGSDVPFFLFDSRTGAHAAMCRGRGEKIEVQKGVPQMHFVVVKPPAGLPTADVYRNCTVPSVAINSASMREALARGDSLAVGQSLFNRLQETAEHLCPWVHRLRTCLEQADVLGHQLSGSGTSYFGICRNARHARQTACRLRGARLGEVFYATNRAAL